MDHSSTFGQRLKHHRKALDLTQAELAQQVGCSVWTIVKIEADQRRPSRQIAARLAQFLNIPLDQQPSFIQAARTPAASPSLPSHAVGSAIVATPLQAHNLPPCPTPLIGRAQEQAAAWQILRRDDVRLLTFTGAPGIGKTLLALHMAQHALPHYADGVWFVSLAAISDPALIVPLLARALGVHEQGAQPLLELVQQHLRHKQVLLLIDNFEHMVVAAPVLADLLVAAPGLTLLITSRVRLRLSQEYAFPLGPLGLPKLRALPPLHMLATLPAIALFVDRAQAITPGFMLTQANAAAIAAICVQLDGVPLAIDLAAARTRLLSPSAMLPRLRSRLALLTGATRRLPERQRSLYATIDWSYALLTPGAQVLFTRLAVFVDGCTLEAIEAVCGEAQDDPRTSDRRVQASIMDQLDELLDHSLIWREQGPDDELRFGMLEILREYATEQLAIGGETEQMQLRHEAFYQTLVATAEPELRGPQQVQWLDRLEHDHGNVRAALRRALNTGAIPSAARLAGALWRFWQRHSHRQEGLYWLEQILAHVEVLPPELRAKLLNASGVLAMEQGRDRSGQTYFEAALTIYRELNDRWGSASTLGNLAFLAQKSGEHQRAIALLEASLECFRELNDRVGVALSNHMLGMVLCKLQLFAQARHMFEEALAMYRAVGDTGRVAGILQDLGELLIQQGDHAAALIVCEESFALCRELGERRGMAYVLTTLGQIALHQVDDSQAYSLFAESIRLCYEIGNTEVMLVALDGLAHIAAARGDQLRQMQVRAVIADLSRSTRHDVRVVPAPSSTLDNGDHAQPSAAIVSQSMSLQQLVESVLEDSPSLEWLA